MFSSQPTRNQTPVVSSIPEVGVVSSHPKDWLVHNDFQESTSSNSQQQTHSSDVTDGGIHVYVHSVDGLSIHGDESEEEVSFGWIRMYIWQYKGKTNCVILLFSSWFVRLFHNLFL